MNIQERGLRPAAELAATRPHGDRIRYMGGCRCDDCRRANTEYEKRRAVARKQGDWNGNVSAAAARAHLLALSSAGVGRHTVADVSGVSDSVLWRIATGDKQTIRARTERAVLAVSTAAAADGAYIDAKPTWKLIEHLLFVGYAKAHLAAELGKVTGALQLGRRRVTARNAFEVERLHARLRHVSARRTLALLEDLSNEGFRRSQVERLLAQLAQRLGVELDLTVREDQIKASAAELVSRLHQQLTAVPGDEPEEASLDLCRSLALGSARARLPQAHAFLATHEGSHP